MQEKTETNAIKTNRSDDSLCVQVVRTHVSVRRHGASSGSFPVSRTWWIGDVVTGVPGSTSSLSPVRIEIVTPAGKSIVTPAGESRLIVVFST